MPGTALVTIGENQWNVEVATTTTELATGLSGRASIPAGTGMLFVLPVTQAVTVTTTQMLFLIDIIFIKDNIVLDIAQSIEPGNLVEEATPCDGFLEVNVGEADLVEVGDTVSVEITTPPPASGFDIGSIIGFAAPLVVLGFVSGMLFEGSSKKKVRSAGHHSVRVIGSSEPTPYGYTKWSSLDTEESAITAAKNTGYRNVVVRREGDKFSLYVPISELGQEYQWFYAKVGSTEMRGRKGPSGIEFEQVSDTYDRDELQKVVDEIERKIEGGHSIHGEPRQRLVDKYGKWAVGRAEAVCGEDDIACVSKEAKRLSEVYRSRYGEGGMEYVTITDPGKTVFHVGDVVSVVALEVENHRVRGLGEKEAIVGSTIY